MMDADEAELRNRGTLLDWIKGLGLPIASLFVSAAIFFLQSQQQAFERQLSNIEDGYRFYFEHRTTLERHVDADQEETLLKLISGTFPNVFCNVRSDLHSRVAAAEASGAPNGFGEDDREILLSMIMTRDAPERMPLSASTVLPLPWKSASQPPKCLPLDELDKSERAQQVAAATASGTVVVPLPAPATEALPPTANSDEAKAVGDKPASEGANEQAVASAPAANVSEKVEAKVRSMSRALDSRMYRVFFQISDSGARSRDSIDPLRAPLAMNSFRVMRGVEAKTNMPSRAEVRYFGPDEEARALDLAAMLNAQFKAEGVNFNTVAIGEKYPNMPRTTLEVWLPDPAGAVATPKRLIDPLAQKLLAPDALNTDGLKKLAPLERQKALPTR